MTAQPVQPFDAAIILGARVLPDGSPSPALARRVGLGVRLLRQGMADRLILSGGPTRGHIPESQVMHALALGLGADPARLIEEDQAMDTIGNARFSHAIVTQRGLGRTAIVTCRFHLPRALYIFHHFGMTPQGIGVGPDHPGPEWWLAHGREVFAFLKTWWRLEILTRNQRP